MKRPIFLAVSLLLLPTVSYAQAWSEKAIFGPTINGKILPSIKIGGNPQAPDSITHQPFLFGGNSVVQLGGAPRPNLQGSPYKNWAGFPVNLVVGGNPSGPFNAGCSACIFTDPTYQNAMIAAIAGDDYRGGHVAAGFDAVGLYLDASNISARLILPVESYTPDSVKLIKPLTPEQELYIKQGMYLSTNSLAIQNNNEAGDSGLPKKQFFSSIIKSVSSDKSIIYTYGWGRQGENSTGTTPNIKNFETYYAKNYSIPVIFIGAPTKMFGRNLNLHYDGSRTGANGTPATSLIHQMEGEEIDLNLFNEPRKNIVSFHGITIGGNITNPEALTKESYGMLLANSLPNHLVIWDSCKESAIKSSGFFVPGKCLLGKQKGMINELGNYITQADKDNIYLNFWITREKPELTGWESSSLNIGPSINNNVSENLEKPRISWRSNNISIISGHEKEILSANETSGVLINTITRLASSLEVRGAIVINDDKWNPFFYFYKKDNDSVIASPSKNYLLLKNRTKIEGNLSVNGIMHAQLMTPNSSHAPCNPGDFSDDKNFHYVCVTENHWKRVKLSDW